MRSETLSRRPAGAGMAPLAAAIFLAAGPAAAHGYAGARFFPATPSTEDPAVADEFGFPTVTRFGGETEISGEFAKRLTRTFGVSIEGAWTHEREDGMSIDGFQNIETSARWQFLTSPEHEALATAGLAVEWGGTGSQRIGAEETTIIAPSLAFGKGFGDLPDSAGWMRAFAVTGILAYVRPLHDFDGAGEPIPTALEGGLSLQYSLPYLTAQVGDPGLPAWTKRLIPLVEFTFDDPVRNQGEERFSATVRPGMIYVGKRMQLGAEAIIPANDEAGDKIGFLFQLHFFLEDLFPNTIGRPLFGGRR